MTLSRRDWITAGIGFGLGVGLLEGVAFAVLRGYPALRATQKVPMDVLYAAPLVTVPVYLGLALGAALVVGRIPLLRDRSAVIAVGGFTWLGASTLLAAPGVLHWAAVVLLGLGLGVTAARRFAPVLPPLVRAGRRRWWIAPLLVLGPWAAVRLAARGPGADRAEAAAAAPNVLILLLDTVRRDRMADDDRLTPRLAQLAARGVTFSNAWTTSSWSLPSQASLLTGRLPREHGADWPRLALFDSVPTLAEYFRGRGYLTAAFSSNTSWITPEYLGRGFDRFVSYHPDNVWRRTMTGSVLGRIGAALGYRREGAYRHAPQLNASLLEFVDGRGSRPFFAYVCYMDVNRSYFDHQHVPRWRRTPPIAAGMAAYDAGLSALDAAIGALADSLAARGILDRTVLVITSDHGESFGAEFGDHEPRGHGTSLFPEQARIPMSVSWPGAAAEVRPGAASLASVAAMVAELTGDAAHPFPRVGGAAAGDAVAFGSLDYDRFSARSVALGPWQYVRDLTRAGDNEYLFDLVRDPEARTNRVATDSAAARLRSLADQLPGR